MATVRWTDEAATTLEETHGYIAADNPAAADRVVASIYERISALADFPELGYRFQTGPEGVVRVLVPGHYLIAYLLRPGDVVGISGVFHGARDIRRHL